LTPAHPAVQRHHRVIFVDLARAMAVVMMVYGHTVSALLAPQYRVGRWFDVWVFQRGLTSCLFLLLSGFAFSLATTRHWPTHTKLSPAVFKRARRFSLFIALGYALHFPVYRMSELARVSDERWRSFLAVDVLQLIGVTFLGVQLLVLLVRSRRVFMAVSFLLAMIVIAVTPAMWSADWTPSVALPLAAYLSPSTGSQFPLFPWIAYVLTGAAAGQLYARWGAAHLSSFANRVLLAPGVALILVSLYASAALFGTGELSWLPAQVVLRLGACFIALSVVAHASRFIGQLPHVFGAVAQESLVIYFVHLCIVYGSIWNVGLAHFYGEALDPLPTVGVVIALVAAMTLLAWHWNRLKHVRPRSARWVSVAAGVLLAAMLI
jgi:uncharacterized membrane protein